MYVVDNATVRALDAATIGSGVPGSELMERAGAGAAEALRARLRPADGTVVVVCGKGNNGGDGLVVARRLHLAGVPVVAALVDPELQGDALAQLHLARRTGVELVELGEDPGPALRALLERRSGRWLIDGVLGTGFRPPLLEPLGTICSVMAEAGRAILALDCPSGLDGNSGEIDPRCPRAQLTVTFGLPKWGLVVPPGRSRCGRIEVIDLGFDSAAIEAAVDGRSDHALWIDEAWCAARWPRRPIDAHKYRVGSLLVVGGSAGMSGAVVLACNAALRAGAGLVEAVVPQGQVQVVDVQCVETLVHAGPQTDRGGLAPAAREGILQRAARRDAVVVGPGAGDDPDTAELLLELMAALERPMVVDADALNAAGRAGRRHRFGCTAVLTPHTGELARLLGRSAVEIETHRRWLVPEAAARLQGVLVHKGAPTFVAAPDGRLAVIGAGGPGLATAGSGDVLSGVVAALLAAGLDAFEAACLGAWVHGRAGDLVAERLGTAGVCARDLPLAVAEVGRRLEGAFA